MKILQKLPIVALVAVHPRFRNNGIGTALLVAAEEYLQSQDAVFANCSSYAPAYFTPGLDTVHNAAGVRLLSGQGYVSVEEPVSMRRTIRGFVVPDDVKETWSARMREGYHFGPANIEDIPDLLAFVSTRFENDWADVLRDSVRRHGRPDRIQIARNPEGAIAGFATHCSYAGPEERFGPFGVDPDERGKSVGKILLNATLEAMSQQGISEAWFLWTDLDSPAGHLYTTTGFSVTHQFLILQKPHAEETTPQPDQGEQQ